MAKKIVLLVFGLGVTLAFQNCVFSKSAFVALHSAPSSATETPARTMTGINLNANIENLILADTESAGISWHRGFFYMFDYMNLLKARQLGVLSPSSAEGKTATRLLQFQEIQKYSGTRTIVTLKWNFVDLERGLSLRVPQPDSEEEKQYFAAARSLIDELGERASVIVVGNEPANETQVDDLQNVIQADGSEPNIAVRFYRRLAWNLHVHMTARKMRADKLLLLGALTNVLDVAEPYKLNLLKRFLYVAEKEPYIDGVDMHIHVSDLDRYQKSLYAIRTQYKFSKKITVTEYSLITSFRNNLNQPLCQGTAAVQFCDKYKLPTEMRELDYLNMAVCRGPLPIKGCLTYRFKDKLPFRIYPVEWADFFRSRPYLPQHFLAAADMLNNQYEVYVATYAGYSFLGALLVDPNELNGQTSPSKPLPIPWAYNGIYNKNILAPLPGGLSQANDYFMDDFKNLYKGP